jgi:hypothetical protein
MGKRTFLCAKGSPLIVLSVVDARLLMVDAKFLYMKLEIENLGV